MSVEVSKSVFFEESCRDLGPGSREHRCHHVNVEGVSPGTPPAPQRTASVDPSAGVDVVNTQRPSSSRTVCLSWPQPSSLSSGLPRFEHEMIYPK